MVVFLSDVILDTYDLLQHLSSALDLVLILLWFTFQGLDLGLETNVNCVASTFLVVDYTAS